VSNLNLELHTHRIMTLEKHAAGDGYKSSKPMASKGVKKQRRKSGKREQRQKRKATGTSVQSNKPVRRPPRPKKKEVTVRGKKAKKKTNTKK